MRLKLTMWFRACQLAGGTTQAGGAVHYMRKPNSHSSVQLSGIQVYLYILGLLACSLYERNTTVVHPVRIAKMGKEGKEKKSAKKEKREKADTDAEEAAPSEKRVNVSVIAKPLADSKLEKKVLKLAKKAAKRKQIKRGVKEVIKAIRKNVKGVCVIAGDISPIDVITPLPVLCEDNDVPYIYVPSKEELGQAGLTKRPTSCMLVLPKPLKGELPADEEGKEYKESYEEVFKKVQAIQPIF